MLSNRVPNTFLVEESYFLPVSGQTGLNFNEHSMKMNSLTEDRATSLKDLCLNVFKEISGTNAY